MITNEEIIKRVMRMGIEHRSGVPYDRLWDVALAELKNRQRAVTSAQPFKEWQALDEAVHGRRFAFMQRDGKLQIVHVKDPMSVVLVKWRSSQMPEVRLK